MRTRRSTTARRLFLAASALALAGAGEAHALPVPGQTAPQVSTGGLTPVISGSGQTMTVDLRAQRTIIDWTSFNIGSGETVAFSFDFRNWLVLNRVSGSRIEIDGALRGIQSAAAATSGTPGGNIWLYSPQGVAFGPNARVDVGGLLATSAAVNAAEFLTRDNASFNFTGSGSGGGVSLAGGAQITADGNVGFIAPSVSSAAGARVSGRTGRTSVMYAAVDSARMVLRPITLGDFNLLDFVVPNAAAGTANAAPINLSGETRAANIYILATARQNLASVLINAPGLLVAESALPGNGQVKIATGRQVLNSAFNIGLEVQQVPGAPPGEIRLGDVVGDGYNTFMTVGDTGIGDVSIASLRAGGAVYITARNITFGPGGVEITDKGLTTPGDLNLALDSSGTVTLPRASLVGGMTVFRGVQQTAARGASGLITGVYGQVTAGTFIRHFNGAAITATGDLTSGGETQLFGSQDVRLRNLTTGGYTRVSSSRTITANAITGVDLDLRSAGGVTAASLAGSTSVSVGTSGTADIAAVTGPTLTIDAGAVRLGTATVSGDARLRTPSLELSGAFTAANLTIEGAAGRFRLGGTDEPGLTNAELQRIRVTGALNLYAGQREGSVNNPAPEYGDFEVLDVTIDTSRIPRLNLYAHSGRQVSVLGTVQVSGSGGVLQIGDPTGDGTWRPERIVISGALGTAQGDPATGFTDVRGFTTVELNAASDILIGSSRFVDLVLDAQTEAIDIGRGLPAGVAPTSDEVGRLFLVAASARLSAGERIVQQNTGAPGQEGGFYLTGVGVPAAEPILTINGARAVDMFGALGGETGVVAGRQASFSRRIAVDSEAGVSSSIRINGCPLGVGCAVSTPAAQFRVEQFEAAQPAAAVDPPLLTPALPAVDEDEREKEPVVTGAGNEEIWRRK